MTAQSFVSVTGDGVTTNFNFPFPYLSESDVAVSVDGVTPTFTWLNASTVQITPAPANATIVELRRSTPKITPLVDFVDGSTYGEAELDLAFLQVFYIVQEAIDIAGGTLNILGDGSYSANFRRVAQIGAPTDASDATTKTYVDAAIVAQLATGAVHEAAAQAWAETAEDVEVTTGLYSAQHHALKAAASAVTAATFDPASYVAKAGGTFTGSISVTIGGNQAVTVEAQGTAMTSPQAIVTKEKGDAAYMPKFAKTTSTSAPTGGADGDVWFQVPA